MQETRARRPRYYATARNGYIDSNGMVVAGPNLSDPAHLEMCQIVSGKPLHILRRKMGDAP